MDRIVLATAGPAVGERIPIGAPQAEDLPSFPSERPGYFVRGFPLSARRSRWRRGPPAHQLLAWVVVGWASLLVGSLAFPGLISPTSSSSAFGEGTSSTPTIPSVVGSAAFGFAGTTGSLPVPFPVDSGESVFVFAAIHYLRTVSSVADSSKDAYRSLGTVDSGSTTTLSVWVAGTVVASDALTVTIALAQGAPTVLTVVVVRGAAANPIDAVGPGAGGSNSGSVAASVAPVSSNDLLLLAIAATGTPAVLGTTSGLSLVSDTHEIPGSLEETGAALSLGAGAPGTYALTAALSTIETWAALALAVAPANSSPPPSGCASMITPFLTQFCQHIQHVVFVVMENHAYDNYFATYCLAQSAYCNGTADGLPSGSCEFEVGYTGTGYPAGSCPKGYIDTWNLGPQNLTPFNLNHNQASSVESICGTTTSPSCLKNPPAMDGFWNAEGKRYLPFGSYNGSTIPIYWDLAQQYALGDHIFSSDPSYSLPNHWYMIAGQDPARAQYYLTSVSTEHAYLNQANGTRTVQDLLNQSPSVTWKYYDWSLSSYHTAITGPASLAYGAGSAYSYWNPMAARAETYHAWYSSHFVNRTPEFFDNLSQPVGPGVGLPNVSWVIPDASFSDHPPANITQGESFVANVIDAVEQSRYWNSTAIFLAWDDYGGFYDHVGPPKLPGLNPLGLSFRVPFLVISPYTPQGEISHQVGYFDSVLRLIEDRWGMGCVNPARPTQDCGAPVLSSFFDFTNLTSPRAPCLFATVASEASYPSVCLEASAVGPLDTTSWVGSDAGLGPYEAD